MKKVAVNPPKAYMRQRNATLLERRSLGRAPWRAGGPRPEAIRSRSAELTERASSGLFRSHGQTRTHQRSPKSERVARAAPQPRDATSGPARRGARNPPARLVVQTKPCAVPRSLRGIQSVRRREIKGNTPACRAPKTKRRRRSTAKACRG